MTARTPTPQPDTPAETPATGCACPPHNLRAVGCRCHQDPYWDREPREDPDE